MSALDGLMGRRGDEPRCSEPAPGISFHLWPTDAAEGDPCLCGKNQRAADSEFGCPDDDDEWVAEHPEAET